MAKCYGITRNLHRCRREGNWRLFCYEHKRQPLLWIFTLIFTVGGGTASIYAIFFPASDKAGVDLSTGTYGEFTQKATLTGLEKELADAAAELAGEARNYFKAAEYDFEARRYRDAAVNYQKSIEALPTISAYMNLGVSLFNLSDLR